MKWKVALSDIDLDKRETDAVKKVLKSKWLSMGDRVAEFEKGFAKYLKVKYAIATNSGTAALHLALKCLSTKPGDEILVPALTFVASVNAILYCQAKPVFVDITSLENFNLSPEDIEKKITKRTKGILVVHYAGFLADMDKIIKIAKKHKLFIVEDSAHAIGTRWRNKMAGAIGDVGCFSFFSNKNMITGEGGMLVTNSLKIAQKAKIMRSHGMTSLSWDRYRGHASSYDVRELGYNYRTNEISASIGIEQLKKLGKNNKKRKELTRLYIKNLKEADGLSVPFLSFHRNSCYHLFPILLCPEINRDKFMHKLKSRGIQTSIHYPLVTEFSLYRKLFKNNSINLPKSKYVSKHQVTLPLHPLLKPKDIDYVCSQVKRAIKELAR
ncbi:MAG: DegT/DnrJ/EryC1/StrS family aminotransferase [candidate division Zixibacteria bacterium]|nr:DegT/DnrJ/EryC1/StrS family aminotransferase [candidate division Zixibacteria bacterium]